MSNHADGIAVATGRSFRPGQQEETIAHVCKRYGLDPEALTEPGSKRNCSESRTMIAFLVWY